MKISDSELAIAREKVIRAYKHLQVAARMIVRFSRHDCGISSEFNPKSNEFDVVARMPDPPPLIGLLAGDCVHNLRSALDHIVYALISTNSDRPPNTPSDRTMFPICDTREGFLRQVNKLKRLDGAPAKVVEVVESLQPYQTREKGLDHTLHPLWVLNRLENIDKHRRLTLASLVARHAHISIRYPDGGETEMLHLSSMIRDRAILASYPPARDGGEVQVSGYLFGYVALKEAKEVPSLVDEDILKVLEQLVEYVGNFAMYRFGLVATGQKVAPRRKPRRQDLRPKVPGRAKGRRP